MENNVDKIQKDEKEDDLLLAAKLGQTLLGQNEELTSENNRLLQKIEVKMIEFLAHAMNIYLIQFRYSSKRILFLKEISRLWKIATIPSLMISNLKYWDYKTLIRG